MLKVTPEHLLYEDWNRQVRRRSIGRGIDATVLEMKGYEREGVTIDYKGPFSIPLFEVDDDTGSLKARGDRRERTSIK